MARELRAGDHVRLDPTSEDAVTRAAGLSTVETYLVEAILDQLSLVRLRGHPYPNQYRYKGWAPERFIKIEEEFTVERIDYKGPGTGWVEASHDQMLHAAEHVAHQGEDHVWRYWVREAVVPDLPTDDFNSVRVAWKEPTDYTRSTVLIVIAGTWYEPHYGREWRPDELQRAIESWEPVGVPMDEVKRIVALASGAIFSEVQEALLKNPYVDTPRDVDDVTKAYREGFMSGRADALHRVSAACRKERDMDEVAARLERKGAQRAIEEIRGQLEDHSYSEVIEKAERLWGEKR